MSFKYLTRVRGAAVQGLWKLISGKESRIQDHLDALTGFRKFSIGHSRLLHCVPTGTFTNLHSFFRPDSVAAVQASLHLAYQRKNLSIVGAFSRAVSLPSVSGPSFQVCGYHIDCLLSEPIQVLGKTTPNARMALHGSRSAVNDFSFNDLKIRPPLPGLLGNHSLRQHSRINYENCGKATMGLGNKKQPNNFLIYGFFIYNVSKRKGCGYSFTGFQIDQLHTSSPAFSSASTAPDVSFNNSTKEEEQSNSSDPSDLRNPIDRTLKLNSGSFYLPHPDKEQTGGEDAHFICIEEQAIGVADGVGGWADLGVDAGEYARELMSNSVNAIQEEPKGSVDPARVLEKAHSKTSARGSSTACIIALADQGLHAINLGDSGFMVVRDGCTVFRSPVQQHDFNFTYQLESGKSGDLPSSGQVFTIPVAPGDVIIAGTDGLFDNLYNNDITAVVVHAVRAGFGPQVTAQKIVALARQRAQDKNRQTPFATAAQEAGFRYYGGKLDDITVVISYITSEDKENSSAKSSN